MARALVQEARTGRRPLPVLLDEARQIPDPSFACEALFQLAQHPKAETRHAAKALAQISGLLPTIERSWRRAEVMAEMARRGPRFRENDHRIEESLGQFQHQLCAQALGLDADAFRDVLGPLSKWAPTERLPDLLRKALSGPRPADDAKVVVALGPEPGIVEELHRIPDPATRARLLAYAHGHGAPDQLRHALSAAATVPLEAQVEVYRAIVAGLEHVADLDLVCATLPDDVEATARILCACAARADRLGDAGLASRLFDEADQRAAHITDEEARGAVARNIGQGRARLSGGAPEPATKPPAVADPHEEQHAVAVEPEDPPTRGEGRPILALMDTYQGDLSDVHLRAIARAAPLCWAFDLDLGLIGFEGDPQALARRVAKSTHIGEGGGYIERLAKAGRIRLGSAVDAVAWGTLVATTPRPDERKVSRLEQVSGRPVVVMGLGPSGLPKSLLDAARHHVELTGRNVSLETATAMGILAERLRAHSPGAS